MVVLQCVASCTSASEGQAKAKRGAREAANPSLQSNSQSVPKTPSIPEDAINGDPVNKEAPQSSEQDMKEEGEKKEEVKKEKYIVAYVPDYPST